MIATNNGHQPETQQLDTKQPETQQPNIQQPDTQQLDTPPLQIYNLTTQPPDTHQLSTQEVTTQSPDTHQSDTQKVTTQSPDTHQSDTQEVTTQSPDTQEVRQGNGTNGTNGSQSVATSSTTMPQSADAKAEDIETFLRRKKEKKLVTTLHLVDGEKGGVGKSLFCRVLLEYAQHKGAGKSIQFVESDVTNPDVGKVYFPGGNYRTAEFSLEERKRQSADHVFELAMTHSVVVNLPSNISMSVNDWMQRNQVVSLGQQFYGVRVCKWFVCTGNHSSIEKFKESLAQFGKKITHVLVRNQMIHDDWPIDDELAALIKENGVLQMKFPRFDMAERNKVDALQLTFAKALTDSRFTALGKQRVRNFLVGCYEELDKLNLIP